MSTPVSMRPAGANDAAKTRAPSSFTRCFGCANGRPCSPDTNWEIRDQENCLLCDGSGFVGCVRIETLYLGDICQDSEGRTLTIRRRSAGPGDLVGVVGEDGIESARIRRAAVRVLRRADVAFFKPVAP